MRSTCLYLCAGAIGVALTSSTWAQAHRPAANPQAQPVATAGGAAAAEDLLPAPPATPPANAIKRPYYGSEPMLSDDQLVDGYGGPGCTSCGACGPCGLLGCLGCLFCDPCGGLCLDGMYVRAEDILWSARGMNVPALITTSPSGTSRENAGVIGASGTTILFGGDSLGNQMRNGGRITVGKWLDPCHRLGIEGDYFAIDDEVTRFQQTSSGSPILARPFYDVLLGRESSELIAFPNVITGTGLAEHSTSFQGAGARFLYNLCCGEGCGTSCITNCPVPTGYRFDAILGWRFTRLDDRVDVVEDLVSQTTSAPGAFLLRDHFQTENHFNGVDFGTIMRLAKGCWTLDLLQKLALGSTHSVVNIGGSTVLTQNNVATQFQGGLLAQRTNIGTYTANTLAMVPEIGATLGYRFHPCWKFTVGYSFIYWSRVARAGDQIDRDVNTNLLPVENPVQTTHLRPEFDLKYADFWVQGVNLGLEGKW